MQWFESWFDSPYYHILYQHRDDEEASLFISNIMSVLSVSNQDRCLDLACGRGRHSKFIGEVAGDVVGIDLSRNSIEDAIRSYKTKHIHFEIGDMRYFSLHQSFDFIFNLFTSFGYFSDKSDNVKTLRQIQKHLKPNGIVVIDYLNANNQEVVAAIEKTSVINGIHFKTMKSIQDQFIVKKIDITDGNKKSHFEERVQLLTLDWFESQLKSMGMYIEKCFGDYELNAFDAKSSKRLIMVIKNKDT